MKDCILYLSLLAAFILYGCDNNQLTNSSYNLAINFDIVKASTNSLDESTLKLYRRDAEVLTVNLLREKDSTKVLLPEQVVDVFFNGLVHIYNSEAPEVETVTRVYQIHTQNYLMTKELIVAFDATHPWAQAWADSNRFTGNSAIDELLIEYDLYLESYHHWRHSTRSHVVLASAGALNMEALAEIFSELEEVAYAEPNYSLGASTNIESAVDEVKIRFTFSKGWGDCPSGCINRHFWEYNVFGNGQVQFVDSYGDPLD